jgi:hypothetical protein
MLPNRLSIQDILDSALSCSDHHFSVEGLDLEGLTTIIALAREYGDWSTEVFPGSDVSSFALGQLKDGRYMVVRESQDYTGHGCQCSGDMSTHTSFEDAWTFGLTQDEREIAGPYLSIENKTLFGAC